MARESKGGPRLVLLDLHSPEFQSQFFALDRTLLAQVVEVLSRLRRMTWDNVYRSPGQKWEQIGRVTEDGTPLHTLRITQKVRAVGFREGDYLRLISLHPDHDSAC